MVERSPPAVKKEDKNKLNSKWDETALQNFHRSVIENSHKIYTTLPRVSAKSWAIFDGIKHQYIYGKCENQVREVASLTKMMTFYAVIQVASKYNIDLQ